MLHNDNFVWTNESVSSFDALKVAMARALFAIKVLVDDDMFEYLLEVETPKKAWDIYASMFAKKPKPIKDKLCYQCGKPGHITEDCKVMVIVVKENSAV